jgi:TonB-linked SusC/RagA family outer membrane protein
MKKTNALFSRMGLLLLLLMITILSFSQNSFKITGQVSDETGKPIQSAAVKVKGIKNTVLTSAEGKFEITVPSTNSILVITSVGFNEKEVPVNNKKEITISLQPSTNALEDVVVVGYGTSKRKDLTGSVASVSGKDIASVPVANVAQAMQGKLPGVNVTSQDGRPGADISIRVRGGGSISQSNQPLILIDGIPGSISDIPVDQVKSIDVLKDASSTAIYGARGANGVVLVTTKGALAGTTNVSFNSYTKFNTPTGYLTSLSPYEYLKYVWANAAANGAAFQTPFEKLYGLGANAGANANGIEAYKNLPTDNIQKDVYFGSVTRNHDLTITGGTDKTRLLFAAGFTDDQGMKVNSYLKRVNLSLKVTQKIRENVTLNLDTRYTNLEQMDDESTTNGYGSLLSTAYQFRPIAMNHILGDLTALRNGNIEQYGKAVMWDQYSPAIRIKDYFPLALSQKFRSNASLDWKIIKGLTYHTDFTIDGLWSQKKYWSGATYNNYMDDASGTKLFAGDASYSKSDAWGLRLSNTLNYDFTLRKAHKFNLLAGQEVTNSGGSGMSIQASRFPSNFTKETAFAQINQYDQTSGSSVFASSVATPSRIQSYFGRVNYSLLDKYLLTLTFRADGSSKFAPTNRWGYFPAAAIAWKLSDEPFINNINWVDNLKVRASFGAVGNDGISPSLWSQSWGSVSDQRLQYAVNGSRLSAYDLSSASQANPNLKWETTITRDAGIDFGFLKNRISGTVDVYWNTTQDLLMLTSIPGITGFTQTYANVGQTSNKGLEVSLFGKLYESKNWKVTVGGNINFNKSNVDALASNVTGLYGSNWAGTFTYSANDYILKQGQPVGLVRGLVYDGFYRTSDFSYNSANGMYTLNAGVPDLGTWMATVHGLGTTDRPSTQKAYPGMPKYKDLNNDGIIDDKDLTVIGNMNAKHTGGFNFNTSYKSFDLGLNFNWSVGNQIYNANKLSNLYGPKEQGVYQNKLSFMSSAYKIYDVFNGQLVRLKTPDSLNIANLNAKYPTAYSEVIGVSSFAIEDGSFLRLNSVVLGYTLPKSISSKLKINNFRIYGSVYNVMTITGYSGLDPEVNVNTSQNNAIYPTTGLDYGTYPRARSYVLGINLSF